MFGIIGIVVIFVMVFGGYMLAGGKMGIILKSLPFEMAMIGGAAVGAFLISNDGAAAKKTMKSISKVFKGVHWKPLDYRDLLCLLFELIRIAGPTYMSQANFLSVGFGVLFGIVLFGERHSGFVWAAMGLMLAGVALVNWKPKPAKAG